MRPTEVAADGEVRDPDIVVGMDARLHAGGGDGFHQPRHPRPAPLGWQDAPGWPDLPKLEALRAAWLEAPNLAVQQALAREIQTDAMQGLPYIPTGADYSFTTHRRNLADRVKGFAIFCGIKRV
jgi:ABC-type transport system substrate-binding protein